jgi:hypothetical protein
VDISKEEFFEEFRREISIDAEAKSTFQLTAFMDAMTSELVETGFVDGYEFCHYRAQRGMRVDGYWFNDEGTLDLFVADFECRNELQTLTKTELEAAFKRVGNFFEASVNKNLASELEVTSPEYGLARQIIDRKELIRKINVILVSERTISDKVQDLPDGEMIGILTSFHIWDISRLYRQRTSRGHKEALNLDFVEMFGIGISCLPAHLGSNAYQSYLIVMPAEILSDLYERFGARLLEQNVRTFLQARGSVNQGIRSTILNEPSMFFAYNNGITATAQSVETICADTGMQIKRIVDLQIVNGGQTTASLFHTRRRDKATLAQIFVQMKLSVIDSNESEIIVPKISEYANTQNKVNAADFFSNHPFHIRIEEYSRRIWAPALLGALRETKWFYERARGQYADAQNNLTAAEQKRFKTANPKLQMFTKTDLAKFENVWDEHPKWVNLGAQKNFAKYAQRIGKEWERSSDDFNEFYFRRAIARGLIFRATEKLVSEQPWYNGGYRANVVAYSIAVLGEISRRRNNALDFLLIWNNQGINKVLESTLGAIAKVVNDDITQPTAGVSNISEWCKKDACWSRIQTKIPEIEASLPDEFWGELISADEVAADAQSAKRTQKIDNGIDAQKQVLNIPALQWAYLSSVLSKKQLVTPKEVGVLSIATQIPKKIPTEKQSLVLLDILSKARAEGIEVA